MSVQENKEITEPTPGDSLPEQNAPETVSALDMAIVAIDNIYVVKEGAQSTANALITESVVSEPEQALAPASLLAETVVATNEVVQQEVVEQVMETVVAANEVAQQQVMETVVAANEIVQEQVMETVVAANEVVQEKVERAAEEVSVVVKEVAKNAEQVLDNIKGVIDGSATKSLAGLIVAAINPEGGGRDLKMVISKDASNIMSTVAASRPAILDDIKKSLVEVTRDNKVNSTDIPQFIAMFQSLHDFVCSLKEFKPDIKSKAEICATVFKIITHFLILDDQICADNADKTLLLTQLDDLIDSGVDLLAHVPTIKLKGCFFSFLCK
jgi:vacuolar-type H+-ATPase subunit H